MLRPLVLILLSDIQIGKFGFTPKNRSEQRAFTISLINHIKSTYDKIPGLKPRYYLFALGDLTSTATPAEYTVVTEELIRIASILNIKRKDIHLCPGNHDYSFDLSKNETTKLQRFMSYANFHNEFYTKPHILESYPTLKGELGSSKQIDVTDSLFSEVINERYIDGNKPEEMNYYHIDDELNLEILSFNSACKCDHTDEFKFGSFPREEILAKYKFSSESKNVRIIIGHHNFESMSKSDISPLRNSRELKQFLFENNFNFLFHGHQHYFELKKWLHEEREVKVIGCGATSASKEELPRGDNQITSVLLNEIFCSIRSHVFDNVNKSWKVDYCLKHSPISNMQYLTLKGMKDVQKANHELIMSAEQRIEQTFINSNIPSEKDDSVRILIKDPYCPKGIQINRIISANGYDQINFIQDNLKLERNSNHINTLMVLTSDGTDNKFVNSLIIDNISNLVMFSDPMNWNTNGVYIPFTQLSHIISSYNRVYENQKPTIEKLEEIRNKILSQRPNTIAESVLTELANTFKDKVKFFGIVGSAVHKETPQNLINDIDIILLLETITTSFLQELKASVKAAIRKRSLKGVILLSEFTDGPIRPEPEDKYTTVYQLHVLPYTIEQIELWPSFIKINRLANHRSAGGVNLSEFIKSRGDIKLDLLEHRTWGIDQLIYYSNNMTFPCYKWEQSNETVSYNKFFHEPKKIWEKLEFLNYIVAKTLRNISIMEYGDELAQKSERQVYEHLKNSNFPDKAISLVSKLIDATEEFRKTAKTELTENNIDELKNNVVSFLEEIKKLLIK